ncbi:hypothetical protein SLS64_010789 [Diaporthe eres]|uniref:Uncharacterized protein n=1 Tax=Diaporthe eres TaxID=83184 RepID=A0ABR1NN04_DIAER
MKSQKHKFLSTISNAIIMSFRLSVARASQLSSVRSARLIATRKQVACARLASSASKPTVKIDQTKKSNNPDESPKPEHHEHGTAARTLEGEKGATQPHPAKQPSPERSTGIQPSGPESKAGEGRAGAVHREKLEGRSIGHSVDRPAPHE